MNRIYSSVRNVALGAGFLSLAFVTACAPQIFRRDLFTLQAEKEGIPVMVSRVSDTERLRPVSGRSGTFHENQAGGNITIVRQGASDISAMRQLLANTRRGEKCVIIQETIWHASDFASYGYSESYRNMTIEGGAR